MRPAISQGKGSQRADSPCRHGLSKRAVEETMKRPWLYALAGLAVLALLVVLGLVCAKPASQAIVSRRVDRGPLVAYSGEDDVALTETLLAVLEKDYRRLAERYNAGPKPRVVIHVFTSNLLYNMAAGNPFPLPRGAGGYAGRSAGNEVYVLVPANWQPLPDSAFPPERTRTLCAHEMAHAFVHELNPAVKGWVTEGVATYEQSCVFNDAIRKAGFTGWIEKEVRQGSVPRFARLFDGTTKITDQAITHDYVFAGTFVDYAVARHGYPALTAFIKTSDFERSFGRSEDEIWADWVRYLNENYL